MSEKRIKEMYNDAALVFKNYLATRNIAKFTDDLVALQKKYDNESDVCNLALWWAARVQGLHDLYKERMINNGNH